MAEAEIDQRGEVAYARGPRAPMGFPRKGLGSLYRAPLKGVYNRGSYGLVNVPRGDHQELLALLASSSCYYYAHYCFSFSHHASAYCCSYCCHDCSLSSHVFVCVHLSSSLLGL